MFLSCCFKLFFRYYCDYCDIHLTSNAVSIFFLVIKQAYNLKRSNFQKFAEFCDFRNLHQFLISRNSANSQSFYFACLLARFTKAYLLSVYKVVKNSNIQGGRRISESSFSTHQFWIDVVKIHDKSWEIILSVYHQSYSFPRKICKKLARRPRIVFLNTRKSE